VGCEDKLRGDKAMGDKARSDRVTLRQGDKARGDGDEMSEIQQK